MDVSKYLTVLVVLCLDSGETGGGGKHHDHVKLHIPEFHHHDHHKKVITIHHHHHQPKKEHHHHHHHHHHKPQIPHGHHYSHHHKKVHLKTHTVSKGAVGHHGLHGHHGHHQKHHKHHSQHHGHHDHHGYQPHHSYYGQHDHPDYGIHHEVPIAPSVSNTPNAIPSYEDEYTSGPSYDHGIPITSFTAPQIPQVHGVTHTVKQVKVFDSLPGALPNKHIANGYQVTEEGEEGEEAFGLINNLQNTYPATYAYVRSAAAPTPNEHFGGVTSYNSGQQTHDPFAIADPSPSGVESFTGSQQSDLFSSAAPTQNIHPSAIPSAEYPATIQTSDFDDPENSFTGSDVEGSSFITNDEDTNSIYDPVTFVREAGIKQTTKTGNVETLVY